MRILELNRVARGGIPENVLFWTAGLRVSHKEYYEPDGYSRLPYLALKLIW